MNAGRSARLVVVALALAVGGLLASPALAETPEEIFARGNAAYEHGRYEEAAEAYRTVIQYGVQDARVEYNLGCAAFKLGRLGEAILHFQRALRMNPSDADVKANLELARSRCFDRVEAPEVAAPIRWARAVQDRIGPDRQAIGLLVIVWLVAALVAWRLSRPGGWNAASGWTLAALLLAGALLAASWQSTRERLEGARLAVVLENTVDVLAGPGENNATLFTVHEGLTVEMRSERQDWMQVSLPNGLNGWVRRDAIGLV